MTKRKNENEKVENKQRKTDDSVKQKERKKLILLK